MSLYVILPSGPLGRPFDYYYSISNCFITPDGFEIHCDYIRMKIYGKAKFSECSRIDYISITDFEKLEFFYNNGKKREFDWGSLELFFDSHGQESCFLPFGYEQSMDDSETLQADKKKIKPDLMTIALGILIVIISLMSAYHSPLITFGVITLFLLINPVRR